MKKIYLLLNTLFITLIINAQFSTTVNVTAGGLDSALTTVEKSEIFNLIITGTIDARDFKTIRDEMPRLMDLDLRMIMIVEYNGTEGTISSNTSYPANAIPTNAFYNNTLGANTRLRRVILPNSLTVIGNSAFRNCVGLTGFLDIPRSVTSIGDFAFYSCSGLTSIEIPASVTNIGIGAFYINSGLINVDWGNQTYSSLNGVLFNKEKTTLIQSPISKTGSYTVPSSVISIGRYAFYSCKGLTSIAIPFSVTTIQDSAFFECDKIVHIIVDGTSPVDLNSTPNALCSINKTTCTLYVPFGAKAKYQSANQWMNFTNIVEMGSENSVITTVAGKLDTHFSAAVRDTVKTLTILGAIDARDFKFLRDNLPNLTILNIEDVDVMAYSGTEGTVEAGSVKYPENQIPQNAFFNNKNREQASKLKSIILPSSLTSIGELSFYVCRNLTSVVIPPSVNSIFRAAFGGCSSLTSIDIPSSVTYIGDGAFMTCGLTSVTIPSSIDTLYGSVFSYCHRLKNVSIPTSVKIIEREAFAECDSLTSISIPTSVTSIGSYAFCYNKSLDSLSIPSSVTSLGEAAFTNCTGLTSALIPSSVTSIGRNAFSCCSGSITVDSNNPNYSSLDGELFNKDKTTLFHCSVSKNGEYIIPSSVTTIGREAFSRCKLLTSVIIPSSVTIIDEWAFRECNGLTFIVVNGTSPVNFNSANFVFYQVNKTTCTLYVPYGSKHLYETASQWKDFKNIVELAGFTLSDTTLSFSFNEGNDSIEILSNTIWTTASDQQWLTVSPATGTGNESLIFTAEANPTFSERTAIVIISADSVVSQFITVTQKERDVVLIISRYIINIAASAGSTAPVSVTSNTSWTVSSDKTWLTTNKPTGIGNDTLVFTVEDNLTSFIRVATVTVSGEGVESQTITVSQSGRVGNTLFKMYGVTLFPNPVTDGFRINGLVGKATLTVSDLSGKQLLSKEIVGNEYISTNLFAKGMYIISITNDKGRVDRKLVKE